MAAMTTVIFLPIAQTGTLAQVDAWDDSAPPPDTRPAPRPMTFSDLQGAMHDYTEGKNPDNSFRNGTLVLLAVIAVVALLIHWRQKRKDAGPPDSVHRLGRELGRCVRFPLGTRMLLRWVAASTKVPFASLLLSSALFDKSVNEWAGGTTFSVVRGWGRGRLQALKGVLFDPAAA